MLCLLPCTLNVKLYNAMGVNPEEKRLLFYYCFSGDFGGKVMEGGFTLASANGTAWTSLLSEPFKCCEDLFGMLGEILFSGATGAPAANDGPLQSLGDVLKLATDHPSLATRSLFGMIRGTKENPSFPTFQEAADDSNLQSFQLMSQQRC